MAKPSWALDSAHSAVRASREPIIRFFSYHDAHPIALTMVLVKEFGHEWFDWAPEALRKEIVLSFNATGVSEQNWHKIQAVRTLMLATGYWVEWEVFEKVTQAFNNNTPMFEVLQRCTLGQMMVGVDIVAQLRQEPYGDEVARYIACCAVEAGVSYLPDPLDFAQAILSDPQYECLDCGRVAKTDVDYDQCDFCSGRYTQHRVHGRALHADVGRNLRKYFQNDPTKVKARYEVLVNQRSASLDEENTEDVQAAKLAVAHQYMQKRRAELVEQLEELKAWTTR